MILKLRWAGVGSAFPARSMALTRNVCDPNDSFGNVCGDVQLLNAWPSTEHLRVDCDSEDLNLNVGVRSWVFPDGPEMIVVLGATVSTVNVLEAGVESTFAAVSM